MSRIRVLFAICDLAAGGSQRQLLNLLERLDRSAFEAHLFLISPVGELRQAVPDDVTVHLVDLPGSPRNPVRSAFAHRARAWALRDIVRTQNIDVIYDRTHHMTLITGTACRKAPVPRASVIVADPRQRNPERLRWLKECMLRDAYHRADAVVTVSEGVRQAAIDCYGLPAQRVETIWNAFDVEAIERQSQEALPGNLARRPDRFRVVAAGRLHREKGFDLLISAARELVADDGLRQLEVIIAGTGDEERSLKEQIQDGGLSEHVILCGYLPNPLPLFQSADLFCLPSRFEGMPNALVEAMCCGVPVVAADYPCGPRDILQDEFGRLVPPENASALANAIREAVNGPPPGDEQLTQAREHIRAKFGIESGVAQVEALLRRLAGRPSAS